MQFDETDQEPLVPGPRRVGGFDVNVVVVPHRRGVRLTVERDAAITAAVPAGLPTGLLADAVNTRKRWLYEKLAERASKAEVRPVKEFVSGEGFRYLGRNYRLKVVDEHAVPVGLVHGRLVIRRDRLDTAESNLIAWYRARGQAWLPGRVESWTERMRLPDVDLKVRKLGHRWGSCSARGGINIHWATMQLPVALVDYVLVHELGHLHVADHSAEFWRVVRRAMPDFDARRQRLDGYGPLLWLPGT